MRIDRLPLAVALALAVGYAGVVAWTSTWPVAPLIPDEAIAKAMADAVAATGSPLPREPFTEYPSGAFVVESYGAEYDDHRLARPPVSVAIAYEQGLVPPLVGRALTLGVGLVALAFLAWRLDGPLAALLAGGIYLAHPAVLYFSQSYFANSGGLSWFLAALALLEASRDRAWLAALAVAAAAVALVYRVEYGVALLAIAVLGPLAGPLRGGRQALAFYSLVAAGGAALVWLAKDAVPSTVVFGDPIDVRQAVLHPIEALRQRIDAYMINSPGALEWGDVAFANNTRDYFLWFFPLTTSLALVGVFARPHEPRAAWVYGPLGIQCLVAGLAILPTLVNYDYSNKSWLESSITRYFLPLYCTSALLAASAVAAVARAAGRVRADAAPIVAGALVVLLAGTGVVQALDADHGVRWANERRAWFVAIEDAADGFGENAVFVGVQPSKVIFSRPVLSPANLRYDDAALAKIVRNLTERGFVVYALDPWFHDDARGYDVAKAALADRNLYWTDTGVVVDCACGERARFWRLGITSATLARVERLDPEDWREAPEGLESVGAPRSLFWTTRAAQSRLESGDGPAVRVRIEVLDDEAGRDLAAGWLNVPVDVRENLHVGVRWTGEGTGAWKELTFLIPRGTVVNGPLFLSPGWTLRVLAVEVTE